MKRVFLIVFTALILTSCSGDKVLDNTLKIMLIGNESEEFSRAEERLEEKLKEDNIGDYDLLFEFVPLSEYADTLYVKALSGKEYDIAFNLSSGIFEEYNRMEMNQKLGNFLLNSDDFKALRELYDDRVWQVQKQRYKEVFGIPKSLMLCGNIPCIFYRKDLADEMGIGEIENTGDLISYFKKCKDENADITPFISKEDEGLSNIFRNDAKYLLSKNILCLNDLGYEVFVLLNENNDGVEDIAFLNETDIENRVLFDVVADRQNAYRLMRDNAIYFDVMDKHIEASKPFTDGYAASVCGGITGYNAIEKALKKTDSNAELGVFFIDSTDKFFSSYSFSEYTVIPFTSSKTKEALTFLNYLAMDDEAYNLIAYGEEGVSWEKTEDIKYTQTDKSYEYNNMLLMKNRYIKDTLPDEIEAVYKRAFNEDNYIISPLSGFKFNTDDVSKEIARVNNVYTSEKRLDFFNGRINNTDKVFYDDYTKLKDEQEKIKAELLKQINSFLLTGENKETKK